MRSFKKPSSLRISLDFRLLSVVLLLIIIGMLISWKPWVQTSGRTLEVSGSADIKTDPDEFVFYPSYQFSNPDKTAALKELADKTNDVVNNLKNLGIPEEKIQTTSNGNDTGPAFNPESSSDPMYHLGFTITTNSKEQAQKVSDYLVTTQLLGSISPLPSFSRAKRKQLESQAREEALKDARAQAEQNAKSIGAKLGSVKSLADGHSFDGGQRPLDAGVSTMRIEGGEAGARSSASTAGGGIMPGQNEIHYTVKVTYFIR